MELQTLVTPAAGMLKTPADARRIVDTDCDDVVFGSYKGVKYAGNAMPDWYIDDYTLHGANSRGIPDEYGLDDLPGALATIGKIMHAAGRTFTVSISGDSPEINRDLYAIVCASPARAAQWNISCFNKLLPGNKRQSIIGNRPQLIKENLEAMRSVGNKPIQAKLPIYTDADLRAEVCSIFVSYGTWCERLVGCNTFPECYFYHPESVDEETLRPRIASGYAGGSGGEFFHAAVLGQLMRLRQELPPTIMLTGVGGVSEGRHAKAFLKYADRVEVGLAYYKKGNAAIQDVTNGL